MQWALLTMGLLATVASGPAGAQTADPAISAYMAKAEPRERERVAEAVIVCRAACSAIGRAARPAARACEADVDKWSLVYAGGEVPSPKHPAGELHRRLFMAKLKIGTYALAQSMSINQGADDCRVAREHLDIVAASMRR